MAALPAATPIMRSRSRRLGEDTAELFSIPTSALSYDSRAAAVGGGRVHLSHGAPPQSRRTRRCRRAPRAGTNGVHAKSALARRNRSNLAHGLTPFRFLYYTRDIKK